MNNTTNFLDQLAVEAEIVDTLNPVDNAPTETVGDLIEEYQNSESPVDMVAHSEKSREVAEELEEIAEKADEVADEDDQYAKPSVESLAREYMTIMKAHKLSYRPLSMESEIVPVNRAKGLARDARKAANDLRMLSDHLMDFSSEGIILNLFKNKDKQLEKAVMSLRANAGKLSGIAEYLKTNAIVIDHNGIAKFLTRGDSTPVRDLAAGLKEDIQYLAKVEGYINDRVKALAAVKPGDTYKSTPPSESEFNKPLMDQKMVKIEAGYYETNAGKGGNILKQLPWVIIKTVGVGVSFSAASSLLLPIIGPVATFVATHGAIFELGSTIGENTREKVLNKSDIVSVADVNDLKKSAAEVSDLVKYTKTSDVYGKLDEIGDALKDIRKENKDTYEAMVDDMGTVEHMLTLLKDHSFTLITGLARTLEFVEKRVSK